MALYVNMALAFHNISALTFEFMLQNWGFICFELFDFLIYRYKVYIYHNYLCQIMNVTIYAALYNWYIFGLSKSVGYGAV